MNLGTLIANWREDERDDVTDPHLFSDSFLTRLFNEAQEEAAGRGDLLRVALTIPIVAGDTELKLPDSIAEVRTARIVESGQTYWLTPSDRYEQDRLLRDWRDTIDRPTAYIHDDTSLTLTRIVSAAADLVLECYKTPDELINDADEPEIAPRHHRKLAGWVKYRAYSVPDTDFFDVNRSAAGLAEFEDYFGRRKDVNYRRDNNANRPHRVKVCL
jgi:hypothetical protein